MLSTDNIGRLLEPVIDRATASARYPRMRWRDQWAEMVLEKLGVAPILTRTFRVSTAQQFDNLQRCKWIDDQLLAFLQRYPDAQVVELNAGLSTRFHRISNACDWPRFSWVAGDTTDVIDIVRHVFPTLDHHARVVFDGAGVDWLDAMPGKSGKPLMIIDDGGMIADTRMMDALIKGLGRVARHHTPVHLLITQTASGIRHLANVAGRPLALLAQSDSGLNAPSFIQRTVLTLKHRLLSCPQLRVAHFKIKSLHNCEDLAL